MRERTTMGREPRLGRENEETTSMQRNLSMRALKTAGIGAVATMGLLGSLSLASAACLFPPGDVTNDGATTVLDVQCSVLANLWSLGGQIDPVPDCIAVPGSPAVVVDHNCDGVVNIQDTLIGIQFALEVAIPLALDENSNQCVDACETDLDGDGTFDVLDCSPYNPDISTTANESCNGWDDDCDGTIDGDAASADSCSDFDVCNGIEACEEIATDLGVIITEIMYNPSEVSDSAGEWFEIFNSGETAVNIQGWTISDEGGEIHVIDAGGALFVPPRGYLVLGRNGDVDTNGGIRINYVYEDIDLVNTGDTITLLTAGLSQVDRVEYGAGFPNATGASIALTDVRLDNEDGANWVISTYAFLPDAATPAGPNVDAIVGYCADSEDLVCDDGNLCTDDSCDATEGCQAVDNTVPCDDGNICTTDDACAGGACAGGPALTCEDDNVCTDNSCDPDSGCVFTNNTAPCDDADACTTVSICADGGCVGSDPPDCNDSNPCTDDSCDPAEGCQTAPNADPCDDGDACTTEDTCAGGSCVGGAPPVCDDGNPCTDDSCDSASGCVTADNTAPCEDGDPCTLNDQCAGGSCQSGELQVCDDSDECTTDACGPAGCEFTPITINCADDGNSCTDDVCNPATGTCGVPLADGEPCDDGEQCTLPDVCQGGSCSSTDYGPCFDGVSNVLCVLSGAAGDFVECPIRMATESGPSPISMEVRLEYPSSMLDLAFFTDGETCFGGGTVCFPNIITGDVGESSLDTGHTAAFSGGLVDTWSGNGHMILIDFSDPTNPLNEATIEGGLVTGSEDVLIANFELLQDIPADSPVVLTLQNSASDPLVLVDPSANILDFEIFGALIISNAP